MPEQPILAVCYVYMKFDQHNIVIRSFRIMLLLLSNLFYYNNGNTPRRKLHISTKSISLEVKFFIPNFHGLRVNLCRDGEDYILYDVT